MSKSILCPKFCWRRANDPELVSESETRQIQRDALLDFLSLAHALRKDEVMIENQNGEDYYLFSDTNQRFAAFFRHRCGFRGRLGGVQVWTKKSEFISDENINRMIQTLQLVEERMN